MVYRRKFIMMRRVAPEAEAGRYAMAGTRRIVIEVEVPEEVAELVERYPWLRRIIAWRGLEWVVGRVRMLRELDSLTQGMEVDEETIMELDRIVKRGIARVLEVKLGLKNEGEELEHGHT